MPFEKVDPQAGFPRLEREMLALWDRIRAFDCQGLWVEVEVEKELGLKSKRDIENLVPNDTEASVARFVQACKDRVDRFARVQTDQSIRLGYWMNWDRSDADWARRPDE